MKKIFLILIIISTIYANQASINIVNNELFILPKQSKEIKNEITRLIDNSKNEILIAMYNFSYKTFIKDLIKASKKGLKVTVILDSQKIEKKDKIYKVLKKNNINVIIPNKKMHLKVAIFDNKYLLMGSANWTKESFRKNYEVILKTNDNKIIFKLAKELLNL